MDLSGCRVFVVDDIEVNIDVLISFLGSLYQVSVALDGETALREIRRTPPDLILLDIMMPGVDGYEVCRQLKQDSVLQDIPVIFLSAMSHPEDIVKGLELGAVDYVLKPFSKDELLLRVKTHLELKKSRELIEAQRNENKELVHILCHDLINPIGYIQSILYLSETRPEMMDSHKELLQLSVRNALEIIELVRQIREVEENKFNLELAPFNLLGAVQEALNILKPKFKNKQITPVVEVDSELFVQAERTSFINSVLNNLLTNALKFSYSGSDVKIHADLDNRQVLLTVTDRGIGIPESLLTDIFDYSKSTSREGTDREFGTGFGMPLLKKFVTLYGGKVEVESTAETESSTRHGTRVSLTLKGGNQQVSDSMLLET